ncbi:porin [Paraburkholderia fungorum]
MRRRLVLPVHLIASLLSAATEARAERGVTLYGLIDTGLSYVTNVATSGGHASLFRYADGVAQGNRWGLRGRERVGDGVDAVFVLESAFSTRGDVSSAEGELFTRKAYVGLSKRAIGELTYGRQNALSAAYVGANYTMGSQSAAGNYAYHINDLDQLAAARISNAFKFSSANFAGFEFGGMVSFSEETDRSSGLPADRTQGEAQRVISGAYSIGLNYTGKSFGLGTACTRIGFRSGATAPVSVTVANVKVGALRYLETCALGGQTTIGAVRVWANVTRTRLMPTSGAGSTLDNKEVGVRYALTSTLGGALGYTRSTLAGGARGRWNQFNVALDYAVSKRTDLYVLAIRQTASGNNIVAGVDLPVQAEIGSSPRVIGNSGSGADSQTALRMGLRHRF